MFFFWLYDNFKNYTMRISKREKWNNKYIPTYNGWQRPLQQKNQEMNESKSFKPRRMILRDLYSNT